MHPAITQHFSEMTVRHLSEMCANIGRCPYGGYKMTMRMDRDRQRMHEASWSHPASQTYTPVVNDLDDINMYSASWALDSIRADMSYHGGCFDAFGLHIGTLIEDFGASLYTAVFDCTDWQRDEAECSVLKVSAINGDNGWHISPAHSFIDSLMSPIDIPYEAVYIAKQALEIGYEKFNEDIDIMTKYGVC